MMDRAQVRALAAQPGFAIGAHTVTHPILTRLADDDARREIVQGGAVLADWLQRPVPLFAYPNGRDGADFDARHRAMARAAGYAAAFSTEPGVAGAGDDFFALPRFTPWRRESQPHFRLELWRNQWRRVPSAAPRTRAAAP